METGTKGNDQFANLLSPLRLNGVELRNRIVSTGHGTRLADNHIVSDRLQAYHETRARGGAGLIITEAAMVSEDSVVSASHLVVADDSIIPSLSQLARRVQAHGTRLFGQLFHLGHEKFQEVDGRRAVAPGPSSDPSERYHTAARAMKTGEIRNLVNRYGEAATRMRKAGLDGVEVAASHGYLLAQFLSPVINRRSDAYGGSFDNRLRFIREILDTVRERIGPDLVMGLRISGDELTAEGLEAEQVLAICDALAGQLDYLNVTSGSSRQSGAAIHIVPPMSTDIGLTVPYASAIRQRVNIPVMAVGRINQAAVADALIAEGKVDFCGMTRALITDPEMPNKIASGNVDQVRVCIGCNQACIDRMHRGLGVSCIQHPETGRELQFGSLEKAAEPKSVLVVGGGPGGMKAAAIAAVRGHSVTLRESSSRLGGQANLAQLLPRRSEFGGIIENLQHDMESAGVRIELGQRVDHQTIESLAPDVLVLATGATVYRPDIEGMDLPHVADSWQWLEGNFVAGSRVIVTDWRCDWTALGVAEQLARNGHQVRLVSNGHIAGEAIPKYMRDLWLGVLHQLGVELIPLLRLYGIDEDCVYFQHTLNDSPVLLEGVDSVIVCHGQRADTTLEDSLEDFEGEIHLLGDCLAPRTAEEAVLEGLEAGARI